MLERAAKGERSVLILDCDPMFGSSLASEFQTLEFDVETVGTPEEALARVAARPPDLVIMDPHLPDGAAPRLLRQWKTEAPGTVVVLVSGHASLSVVVAAMKEGAKRFFSKPVRARELLDELENGAKDPLLAAQGTNPTSHLLGTAGMTAEAVDRFFSISPGLLAISGFDGYFKMLNPAWVQALGYSVDELCSRPHLELVHPDDREKASDEALELRGGVSVFRFKNRYRCKDDSYRWLAWSATPSPAHALIYATARDVTNSVRMEQGLRASNEQLKRVLATSEVRLQESVEKNEDLVELGLFKDEATEMLVHDLKNPLAVILSNYEFILEGFDGASDCREALRDSHNAGRRMVRLMANLLDVRRFETGALTVRPIATTVGELLQPIVRQRRIMTQSRNISIEVAGPLQAPVNVDYDLVTRTAENIFDNALRYTPDGGHIELEVATGIAGIEIRIGNSGPAIPVEVREKIFEKNLQHGTNGRMNLGLGLYFCRLAIEANGGRIWVEETARLPVVFCIRLPLAAGRGSEVTAAPLAA